MFKKWLDLSKSIAENTPSLCPECGCQSIDYQYVGDLKTRVGYLDIWCRTCLKGIHISRVIIPEGVSVISFEAPIEDVQKRIPKFKQVAH